MNRHVLVYSIDLFRGSEFFIAQQALSHSWEVTFAGERLAGAAPAHAQYVVGPRRPEALHQLDQHPPDIVHAHFGVGIPRAARLASHFGVPLVVTLHGFDVTRRRRSCVLSGRPNLMRYGISRPRFLRLPDRCFAVSNFIRDQALRAGALPARTQVHHIGTSLDKLPLRHCSYDAAAPLRIVHVARLVEKKGTLVLLHALAAARDGIGPVALRIVGDGPLRPVLSQTVQRLGLAESVQFLGAQTHDRTLEAIADSDALCLPSIVARNGDAEGLGMVLLEAAAIGTPIVATASGGIIDFVEAGKTGLLVPPNDASALGHAFTTLRNDRGLIDRLVAGARRRVASEFDVEKQTAKLEADFDEVIAASSVSR